MTNQNVFSTDILKSLLGEGWESKKVWYGVGYTPGDKQKYHFRGAAWQEHLQTLDYVLTHRSQYYTHTSYTDKDGNPRESSFCVVLRDPSVLCVDCDDDTQAMHITARLIREHVACVYEKSTHGAHFFFRLGDCELDHVLSGNNHCRIPDMEGVFVDYCPGIKNCTALGWGKIPNYKGLKRITPDKPIGTAPGWLLAGIPPVSATKKKKSKSPRGAVSADAITNSTAWDPTEKIPEGTRNARLFELGIAFCAQKERNELEIGKYLNGINEKSCQPPLSGEEVNQIALSCLQSRANTEPKKSNAAAKKEAELLAIVDAVLASTRWGWATKKEILVEKDGVICELTDGHIAAIAKDLGTPLLKPVDMSQIKTALRGGWTPPAGCTTIDYPQGVVLCEGVYEGKKIRYVLDRAGKITLLEDWFAAGKAPFAAAINLVLDICVPSEIVDALGTDDPWPAVVDEWLAEMSPVWRDYLNDSIIPVCRKAVLEMIANFVIPSVNSFQRGIWLLYGRKETGKSTIIDALCNLLTDRPKMIATYTPDRQGRFGLAGLTRGVSRLVCPEIGTIDDHNFPELKSLAAGDFVQAEAKGRDIEGINRPICCIFGTNKMQGFEDRALRDRFVQIGFKPLPAEKQIPGFAEILAEHAMPVIALAMEHLKWLIVHKVKFSHPQFDFAKCDDDVADTNDALIKSFVKDMIVFDSQAQVTNKEITDAFTDYATITGAQSDLAELQDKSGNLSSKTFWPILNALIESAGAERKRIKKAGIIYRGFVGARIKGKWEKIEDTEDTTD